MKSVADVLSVSRSNLYARPSATGNKRGSYLNLSDDDLLPYIMEIVDARPTYGYRRVCAVLNRKLEEQNLMPVNHKRIYRIMKLHGLLLQRFSQRHEKSAHTGKIVTSESNQRWCGDGFEIKCDNGEKVRAIFVLDCCDREIIGFEVSRSGYTAAMAQNAILDAVENRFHNSRTFHWVEWLTDNGSCFIAKDTLTLCRDIGVINCFTPIRSPESNGMAEAFVKTIKRDYAKVNSLPDAETVMAKMKDWVEDYNEYAPHKGLKWLSPRQFIRKRQIFFTQNEISLGAAQSNEAA